MNTIDALQEIINDATLGAEVAQSINNDDVQRGAHLAETLLGIANKAIKAYQNESGKPIDLSLLHEITPVE